MMFHVFTGFYHHSFRHSFVQLQRLQLFKLPLSVKLLLSSSFLLCFPELRSQLFYLQYSGTDISKTKALIESKRIVSVANLVLDINSLCFFSTVLFYKVQKYLKFLQKLLVRERICSNNKGISLLHFFLAVGWEMSSRLGDFSLWLRGLKVTKTPNLELSG